MGRSNLDFDKAVQLGELGGTHGGAGLAQVSLRQEEVRAQVSNLQMSKMDLEKLK